MNLRGCQAENVETQGRVKVVTKGAHVGEVDSRFRGNDVISVCTLIIVIPAKAEIHRMAPCALARTSRISCTARICRRSCALTCPRPRSNMHFKGGFPHHDWSDGDPLSCP